MMTMMMNITTNALAATLPIATTTTKATVIAVTFNTATRAPMNSSSALLTLKEETMSPTPKSTTVISANRSSSTSSSSNYNKNTRLRKRHSKRHSDWDDYYNYNESILEWANPCGGIHNPPQKWGGAAAAIGSGGGRGRVKRKTPKQIFNKLKKSVGNEFKTLSANQQNIDISNIKIWFLHEYTYKFLPKLKANSSIALKRWHRNFQTYVASFAYLRRVQLKWEHSKTQRESRTARELKDLFLSSRSMLCDLEMAINNTHPYQPKQKPHLQIFSREQMNKRLKLRTKRRAERNPPEVLHEADTIDLKFVKYYYYEFLETMWKVLRKNLKRRGQIAIRTRNRKEFNEVSKNFGSLSALTTKSEGRLRQKKATWLQEAEEAGEPDGKTTRRAQQRQRSLRRPQTSKAS